MNFLNDAVVVPDNHYLRKARKSYTLFTWAQTSTEREHPQWA